MQETSLTDEDEAAGLSQSAIRRRNWVDCQIRTFNVMDPQLLSRMLEVPREHFLPKELASLAYSDAALHIKPREQGGEGRALLSPPVLARLLQGAAVAATDSVLDVAPGTGYTTALLAGLAGCVAALESDPYLYKALRSNLDAFGLASVQTILGPLAKGAPAEAPFDLIFINGAVEANLDPLFGQLKEGGRLVAFQRLAGDSAGHLGKAVRYEKIGGSIGYRILFDASAPVLDAFRKVEEFTFL